MPIIHLLILLVVIGLLLWVVNTYIPMEPTMKKIVNIVVIIAVILWLLSIFGIFDMGTNVRVGGHTRI